MQAEIKHLTLADLEAGLDDIRNSPKVQGVLDMIVSRPEEDAREVMALADLDPALGLVGDNWQDRPSSRSADGKAHPDMQINMMNSRVIALVAQDKDRWQLAGNQLFVDLDLSAENVPPGTKIAIGSAILALKLVSSPTGKELQLRGICAKVVRGGEIRPGDLVKKS